MNSWLGFSIDTFSFSDNLYQMKQFLFAKSKTKVEKKERKIRMNHSKTLNARIYFCFMFIIFLGPKANGNTCE